MSQPRPIVPATVHKPESQPLRTWLSDLTGNRAVMLALLRRDFLIRYRHWRIGLAWVLIRPLATALLLGLIFWRIAGVSYGEQPPLVFILIGMLCWQMFAGSVLESGGSLSANRALVTKSWFPRAYFPLSCVMLAGFDLLIGLIPLALVAAWLGIRPGPEILLLPLALGSLLVAAAGLALMAAIAQARLPDVRNLTPFVIQLLLLASPIGYGLNLVPSSWRIIYSLNPLVAPIELLRSSVLGSYQVDGACLLVSAGSGLIACLAGIALFRRWSHNLADFL